MAASTSHSLFIFLHAASAAERIIRQRCGHASAHVENSQARDRALALARNGTRSSTSMSTITKSGLLVFPKRAVTVCADEQNRHRGSGQGGLADQWRLRCFPR